LDGLFIHVKGRDSGNITQICRISDLLKKWKASHDLLKLRGLKRKVEKATLGWVHRAAPGIPVVENDTST
jgi:hypothetical protein